MDLTTAQLAAIGFGILISGVVHGAIGFAVALISIPIFLVSGLSLAESIFITLLISMVQNLMGLSQTWSQLDVPKLSWLALLRVIAIPFGFLLMSYIAGLGKDVLQQVFGIVLLLLVMLQFFVKLQPKPKLHSGWSVSAMLTSGFAQGSIGIPGPPLAFWVMAHDWNPMRARGTLFFLFATGVVPHFLLLFWATELSSLQRVLLISIAGLPLSIAGTWTGLWIGKKISATLLRQIIMGTLVLLSLKLILFPSKAGSESDKPVDEARIERNIVDLDIGNQVFEKL